MMNRDSAGGGGNRYAVKFNKMVGLSALDQALMVQDPAGGGGDRYGSAIFWNNLLTNDALNLNRPDCPGPTYPGDPRPPRVGPTYAALKEKGVQRIALKEKGVQGAVLAPAPSFVAIREKGVLGAVLAPGPTRPGGPGLAYPGDPLRRFKYVYEKGDPVPGIDVSVSKPKGGPPPPPPPDLPKPWPSGPKY